MKEVEKSTLDIQVFDSREQMGAAAGAAVEAAIEKLLREKQEIRMVFAAAPSQSELLAYLRKSSKIDWRRIVAFHMDEYIGLPQNAPQSFGNFLSTHLFNQVPLKQVHLMDTEGDLDRVHQNASRYGELLTAAPIDIICLGIGENGHIAFNDPPVADFNDPEIIKTVVLDDACRKQQVNDGMFPTLEEVPQKALTLTIPALLKGGYLFCVVPGTSKQRAVYNTIYAPVAEACPATILRRHPRCKFYFDKAAYSLVKP